MLKKGKLLAEYAAASDLGGGLLDFYDHVTDELKHRNPSGKWEADVRDLAHKPIGYTTTPPGRINKTGLHLEWIKTNRGLRLQLDDGTRIVDELDARKTYENGVSFFAEYAVELFRYFPIGYTAMPPGRIKVFELGKTGLHLEYAKGHLEYAKRYYVRILPKCHDGFYRDWEHDGICVAESQEMD